MRASPEGIPPKAGQVPDWSECTPWNLHEATGRHLPRALARTDKNSAGRLLRPKRGDAKGGNALWRAFASFWRVPKGWRRAGAQPRWPVARPKPGQLRYNTQNTVSVATRLQANPPRDALGGNAEVSAWQCARHCARSYKAKCKPAGHAPGGNAEAGARRCANALPEAARQSANPSGGAWRRCRGKHLLRRGARWP